MLIDTDVLIWMTRGHRGALARLQALVPWHISAVTYMELAQGCRNKEELARIKQGLLMAQTEIIPLNTSISHRAIQLIDTYALSHGLQLGDALIAATALEGGLPVLTANTKHFSPIQSLQLEAFVP
jgi:predicted nucleic acid-binding protein